MGKAIRCIVGSLVMAAALNPAVAPLAEIAPHPNALGRRPAAPPPISPATTVSETVRQWPQWKVDLHRKWVATTEPQPGWMEPNFAARGWVRVAPVSAPFPADVIDQNGKRYPAFEAERSPFLQLLVKPFWHPNAQRPNRTVYFRREFDFTEAFAGCASYLSVDDRYEFFVNGIRVASGSGDTVETARQFYIQQHLRPGKNVLALAASSSGGNQHALVWTDLHQAFPVRQNLPMSWLCSTEETRGWEKPEFKPRGWVKAVPVAFHPHFQLQGSIDSTPIWHPSRREAEETVYFRLPLRLDGLPNFGSVEIAADNAWELYVNGKLAGIEKRHLNPTTPRRVEIGPLLRPGENVIAVKVDNYGGPGALACLPRVKVTF